MPADHSRRGFLSRLSAAFVAAPAITAIAKPAEKTTDIRPEPCHTSELKMVNLVTPGSGYLVVPRVSFGGGGGGSGATIRAS